MLGFHGICLLREGCAVVLGDYGISWVSSLIQLTLVISNSKGLSETLRDIRTLTYQICGNEKTNKSNSTVNK